MASPELDVVVSLVKSLPLHEGGSVLEWRAALAALAANAPPPEGVACAPVDAGGVPAEWVGTPDGAADGVLLYLHGGGYCMGSLDTHRPLVARLSAATGLRALALDYRLAPEHPFPAAVDDATAAYRWLLRDGLAPRRVVVAGDSAGGGLAVATLVALRDAGDPVPAAGVCLSPWVDLEGEGESMTARAHLDPMVQREALRVMAAHYLGAAHPRTPLAAPLHADLRGLPPLLVQVGTRETLLDDATRLAARAQAAGVAVALETWEDMIHVWHAFAPMLPEADRAIARIGAWVRERLGAGR